MKVVLVCWTEWGMVKVAPGKICRLHCNSSVIRKIFKRPQAIQYNIVDKETVDEIIFRTQTYGIGSCWN